MVVIIIIVVVVAVVVVVITVVVVIVAVIVITVIVVVVVVVAVVVVSVIVAAIVAILYLFLAHTSRAIGVPSNHCANGTVPPCHSSATAASCLCPERRRRDRGGTIAGELMTRIVPRRSAACPLGPASPCA